MWMDIAFVVFCLVLVVLMMAFIINPPEAWIKRVFHGKAVSQANTKSRQ
jgi:uncharacterized membrane protein